ERVFAVPGLQDAEALTFQGVREELLDRVLVVDEEDGRGVGHVGSACFCLPGISLPGDTAPTIAPYGDRSAPDRAAPAASRPGAAAGQRPALSRDLAARRTAAPRDGVQRRPADRAAARVPAGVRRPGGEAAHKG